MNKRQGMSIVEVMVAATIILLGLLTLLGVISSGLAGTRNSAGHHTAVYHARQFMELIRARRLPQKQVFPPAFGFSDPASARIPLDAPPFEDDFPANTGYFRQLVTGRVSSDPKSYQARLYEVEVTVYWKVRARENKFRLVGLHRAI